MRITTLGTSHGNPTHCRFNSSTLIEAGGHSYLVDSGEPVTALMIRAEKDFDALKAIFITHMHGDHVAGLPSLIKMLMKYRNKSKSAYVFLSEEEAIPGLGVWLKAQHIKWPSPIVSLKTAKPGVVFQDDTVQVEAVPTRHLEHVEFPISFAYVFRNEDKRVIFTGDLRGDFSDFPSAARDVPCDLCLCESTHYPTETAIPILADAPIGKLILCHVGDEWHGHGEDKLRKLLDKLPYPAEIANDGDVFEL